MLVKTKETFGSLDIVCNNAGIEDETNWEKLLSIKLGIVVHVHKTTNCRLHTDPDDGTFHTHDHWHD